MFISTCPELVGSIIAILLLAIAYEGLKSLREFLMTFDQRRKKKELAQSIQDERTGLLSHQKKEGQPTW